VLDGGHRLSLGGHQQRTLLALLLLRANEVVPVDRIIEELWGEEPPASATKSVHALVSKLRSRLEHEGVAQGGNGVENGVLLTRPHGYVLTVAPGELDVDRFQALVQEARSALAANRVVEAAENLREALALWRGPPLAEFAYDSFAQIEIAKLEELRLAALEERIDADLMLGRERDVIHELEAHVAAYPLRERPRAQLMLALYRSGRQAEALDVYQRARQTLVGELGIEPGSALQQLEAQILNHDPVLDRPIRDERPSHLVRRPKRRRAYIAALTALLLAAAATAAAVEMTGNSNSRSDAESSGSVAAIDPSTQRIVARVDIGNTASAISVGEGSVWALNADDQTIAQIDPETRTLVKTFGTGGIPTDLDAGAGGIWVGDGFQGELASGVPTTFPRALRRIDPETAHTIKTIELSRQGGVQPWPGRSPGETHVAVGEGSIWVLNPNQTLARIDPLTNRVIATVPSLRARTVATGLGSAWAIAVDGSLVRINPRTTTVAARIPLAAASLDGIAFAAGAVWMTDPFGGSVWRIDPDPLVTRTIPVGIGVTGIAAGRGAVWASNDWADTITRIAADTNRVTNVISIRSPQDVTVGAGMVWAATKTLAPASCGKTIYGGAGNPDYVIVSDLPLQTSGRDRLLTSQAVRGIALVLRQHHYRAAKYTVGYRSCDDSTAQAGSFDVGRCVANAKAYADDRSVIGVIGTYNSACAEVEIPITNRAPKGPLAMVSGWNTFSFLTRRAPSAPSNMLRWLYPSGKRNYVRLIAEDRVQLLAGAMLARQLGSNRVFLLSSASPDGREIAKFYRHASSTIGLKIVGSGVWSPDATGYRSLVEIVARSHADVVYLGGLLPENGGRLVRDLRSRLGTRVKLIAPDTFLPIADVLATAGQAAVGMYITVAGKPNRDLPIAGKQFLKQFRAAEHENASVSLGAAYAAQAAEVLLAAIARSDGSRTSVSKELLATRIRHGIIGSVAFDRYGDTTSGPITVYRVIGGRRQFVIDEVLTPTAGLLDHQRSAG
jgi:DNA-binding SARP family transcriptional activator/ABC-type branched-subunit amino acid transport system substrate-binding protein/DNA-binding beta-propeller fold protein YncE